MDNGITQTYCPHYPYVKGSFNEKHISSMRTPTESLIDGTAPKAIPENQQVSIAGNKPLMVTRKQFTIVFDPEHIK
jgi:hypothetical protein